MKGLRVTDLTRAYLRDVAQRGDRLSQDEEVSLGLAIQAGDRAARSRLIEANLGLVVAIAKDYRGRGLPLDDLIGEGNIGLITAVDRFDPSFETRFSIYARHWIHESIRAAFQNTSYMIRVPRHAVRLFIRWRRYAATMTQATGVVPSDAAIARALGYTEKQVGHVAFARASRQFDVEDDPNLVLDSLPASEDSNDPFGTDDPQRAALNRRLDRLTPRERQVVVLRYGIGLNLAPGAEQPSYDAIGRTLGFTGSRARKLASRALSRMGGPGEAGDTLPLPQYRQKG